MPAKYWSLLVILALLSSALVYAGNALLREPPVLGGTQLALEMPAAPGHEPRIEHTADSKPLPDRSAAAASPKPDDRLVGRIVDFDGNGLAGIKLRLRSLRHSERDLILRRAVTDAGGRFSLTELDPESVYLLYIEASAAYPGFRQQGFTLGQLPTPYEIRLPRLQLVDLLGTVVDAEHAPLTDFTLTVDSLDTEYPSRTVTSDASGQFQLLDFPVGGLRIYTAAPEQFRIMGLAAMPDEYRSLTLVVDHGRYRLAGRVFDERGAPVAPARVTLSSLISGIEYRSQASRSSLTDASGGFEFTGLGGIPHTLNVYANGYQPHTELLEFQSFSDRVEVRLRR